MKIDPTAMKPPFARPAATFDRPSRSFADFLGDGAAQQGPGADQASSFGAKGMFGSAAPIPAAPQSGSRPAAAKALASGATVPGEGVAPVPGDALGPEPVAIGPSSPGVGVSPADGGEAVNDAEGPAAAAPQIEVAGVSGGVEALEDEPGPEGPAPSPVVQPDIETRGPTVLVMGEGPVVDMAVTSPPLAETDREKLRRLAARAMAAHGMQLGELRLNGEPLTTTGPGGTDGRFPG